MAMRERCDTARAVRRTAIKPRYLSRLVDEHQPVDVDLRLTCLPRRAFSGHVRPILLAGVRCFIREWQFRLMASPAGKSRLALFRKCFHAFQKIRTTDIRFKGGDLAAQRGVQWLLETVGNKLLDPS